MTDFETGEELYVLRMHAEWPRWRPKKVLVWDDAGFNRIYVRYPGSYEPFGIAITAVFKTERDAEERAKARNDLYHN